AFLMEERRARCDRIQHADREEPEPRDREPGPGGHGPRRDLTHFPLPPRSSSSIDSRMLSRCFGSSSVITLRASSTFVASTKITPRSDSNKGEYAKWSLLVGSCFAYA